MSDEAEYAGVIWSSRARRDLQTIQAYIGQFAPLAAQRLGARLVAVAESLAFQPYRGRALTGEVRELAIVSPYLIRYQVAATGVVIVRIKHGAQRA